ncbi:hypothetical protein CDAR_609401 [Caerostris darwini]|uniref:Uncharacterized protein n=1 Tax=Caerostris darwini TaxID=1538125 RepID=A0AAV4VXX0_9ARAC|nr:hypothetical protein CDAR_609401 [Caerostris darwini]
MIYTSCFIIHRITVPDAYTITALPSTLWPPLSKKFLPNISLQSSKFANEPSTSNGFNTVQAHTSDFSSDPGANIPTVSACPPLHYGPPPPPPIDP